MKTKLFTRIACLLLAGIMLMGVFAACSSMFMMVGGNANTGYYDFGQHIDDEGHFRDVDVFEYVTLPEYKGLEIPAEMHKASDEAVNTRINELLTESIKPEKIMDAEIKDGDSVNIDYLGKTGGVAFDGGSTDGAGTDVVIGETQFVDDFIEQLKGHKPGDKFDINVDFPADYQEPTLSGKPAVFSITINHINGEKIIPELTDEVTKTFTGGEFNTVVEYKKSIATEIETEQLDTFITNFINNDITCKDLPETVLLLEQQLVLNYHQSLAMQSEITFEEYLGYNGLADVNALLAETEEMVITEGKSALACQAIAEAENLVVTDADIVESFGDEDYSQAEEVYGKGYLKMATMRKIVSDFLLENAVKK